MAEYVTIESMTAGWDGDDYRIAVSIGGMRDETEYRLRMFYGYSGISGFSGSTLYGLYSTTVQGRYSRYDDWDSAFRPPRADSEVDAFNTEIIVGFSEEGRAEAVLDGRSPQGAVRLRDALSGHSIGKTADGAIDMRATQVIVEEMVQRARVMSLTTAGGVVTATTETPHGFDDGDCVSIYGVSKPGDDTSTHKMGRGGERYMGTFRISVTSPTEFSYTTAHYSSDVRNYKKLEGCYASKWVACVHHVDDCEAVPGDDDLEIHGEGIGRLFRAGDYVLVVDSGGSPVIDTCARVKQVFTGSILLDCPPDAASGAGFGIRYCGSSPSAAVPVNWPMYALSSMDNVTLYDHTVNTVKLVPSRDAGFSYGSAESRGASTELSISGRSFAVLGFIPPLAIAADDAGATLNIFVTGMTDSMGSIILYQMRSSGWEYTMSADVVREMVGDTPVSSATISNPSMGGGPDRYVQFHIPGHAIRRWMMESNKYPMDMAVMYVGTGSASILSSESGYPPYMVVTGGEKAVTDPPVFAITAQVSHAAPGSLVRFTVQEGAEIDDSVFSDSFWFVSMRGDNPETEAFIVSGTNKYVDVIVPDSLNGDYVVDLRGRRMDGTMVSLTDGSCKFYVDGNPQMRVVRLADKVAPGTNGKRRIGRRGIYTRDFAFDGFVDITDGNALLQNVYSILLTRRGERLFMPLFGTTLEDRIFDLMMAGDDTDILMECIQSLKRYEPRVTVSEPDSFVTMDDGGNGMTVTLGLIFPAGSKQIIRLPFKHRGTTWHD